MAKANGSELPFLVAGGGIGGLITAYALARKGFPVRVFEQAAEFKELGAGIQLGPNIFRAIERVGLKASMLDDAWVPSRTEMRDAVSGDLVTGIPFGEPFMKRFGQPYAVTHRADIHGVYLRACQGDNLVSANYNLAADYANQEAAFTKQSTAIQEFQQGREVTNALGQTTADVAGAGFAAGARRSTCSATAHYRAHSPKPFSASRD
jgi:2-polyprenyl-6-methoxyphenol hydroxylase-like FAD-dependent oxidoreductase